jgi:hypothetical protein
MKDERFTFKPGELRKAAFNPALHGKAGMQKGLLRRSDFQITYSFPSSRRMSVQSVAGHFIGVRAPYGSERFTHRQLYDFLCARFNGGERFVDVYFQLIFPRSAAGRELKRFEKLAYDAIEAEYSERLGAALERRTTLAGAPDMRTREGLRLREFDAWKKAGVRQALQGLGRIRRSIRDEIIQCLSTGKIRLNHVNKPETMRLRRDLGLHAEHVFYASGKLIESIEIDIRVPEDAFAA